MAILLPVAGKGLSLPLLPIGTEAPISGFKLSLPPSAPNLNCSAIFLASLIMPTEWS